MAMLPPNAGMFSEKKVTILATQFFITSTQTIMLPSKPSV